MQKTVLIAVAIVMALICSSAYAETTKVLFFEAALTPADTTLSAEPSGYAKLADTLRKSGMLVASMSSGEIDRQKLSPYDIVVLHPSPERPFGEQEISALVWFVAQAGGALFVHGGPATIVNPVTQIFGISMDTSTLIDTSSVSKESATGRQFVLNRFPSPDDSVFKFADAQGLGFQGGPPLILSSDAVPIITGDADCFSDNGLYSIGSFPPVAAAVYMGRGVVLVKSDRTMLSNATIGAYANMKWAQATFGSLAALRGTGLERDESLFGLRARVAELEKTLSQSSAQIQHYESDLTAANAKAANLQAELKKSDDENKSLSNQLNAVETEKNKLSGRLAQYQNPDTLKIAGGAAIGLLFVVFLIGFFIGRRTMRGRI